ncbi:MAG: hypothetical protein Q4G59_07370 [Planctomycetia bacterium]|nr:hypothetical protein [Planctomycetia bacterium]
MKKSFQFLFVLLFLSLLSGAVQAEWYKGNFHMHTYWSDGGNLPENAIAQYQKQGYQFLCLTDHVFFQSDTLRIEDPWKKFYETPNPKAFEGETSRWRPISPKSAAVLEATKRFGADSLKFKTVGKQTYYRLATFSELEKRFNKPGKFVLIPGFELSTSSEGRQNHCNLINFRGDYKPVSQPTMTETIRSNYKLAKDFHAQEIKSNEPWLFSINHPIWRYYDISPQYVIDLPEIRFFELNNNGLFMYSKFDAPYYVHPDAWTPEKWWDIVNSFRAEKGQPLLIALGSDDRHSYDPEKIATPLGPHSWSWVDADSLTPTDIVHAVSQAKVYCSNGITLQKIAFDKKSGTLDVEVKADSKLEYRIEFFGTKKGFDKTSTKFQCVIPDGKRKTKREIDLFSEQIGIVLKKVDGTKASYTLKDDDLYVRARVITLPVTYGSKGKMNPLPAAWSQAFTH